MASLIHVARPYANAAFEYACDQQQITLWQAFLNNAASIAQDKRVKLLMRNLKISSHQLFELFYGVLKDQIDDAQRNFLLMLAHHKRLPALPEIVSLFNSLHAALEKTCMIRLVTAVQIPDDFELKLTQALAKRLNREITLQCSIDPSLIAGAEIYIGDEVIDYSVRGMLSRLLENSLR